MIPQNSQLYEELPDDIFQDYLRLQETESKNKVLIAILDINCDINEYLKDQIVNLFSWANDQGLQGNKVLDLEICYPVNKCNRIGVICKIVKNVI